MSRPTSIVQFERLYLTAIVLGLVGTVLGWNKALETLAANAQTAAFGPGRLAATAAFGLLINVVLWYFVARNGSSVAKWIVVVLAVLGVGGVVIAVVSGRMPGGSGGIIAIVRVALTIVAVIFLFRPDTKAWFGEPVTE